MESQTTVVRSPATTWPNQLMCAYAYIMGYFPFVGGISKCGGGIFTI